MTTSTINMADFANGLLRDMATAQGLASAPAPKERRLMIPVVTLGDISIEDCEVVGSLCLDDGTERVYIPLCFETYYEPEEREAFSDRGFCEEYVMWAERVEITGVTDRLLGTEVKLSPEMMKEAQRQIEGLL